MHLYWKRVTGALVSACLLAAFCVDAGTNIAWRTVGEPGNPADPLTGRGGVGQVFEIMATEVPNGLYCDFLNAVAAEEDPHGLYSPLMAEHFFGGIVRIEGEDSRAHRYSTKPGYAQLPVVFVSWFDAARFANWVHYGMPRASDATEGDAAYGAYDTRDFRDPLAAGDSARRRRPDALCWLPDQDEWLKAGFYGGQGRWWRYATQSDTLPVSCAPAAASNQLPPNAANYYGREWAAPFPHLTPVGAYPCPSHFGTYDQNGNAFEWVETLVSDARGFRRALGGAVFRYANSLEKSYLEGDRPDKKLSTIGFRLARRPGAGAAVRRPAGSHTSTATNAAAAAHAPEYVLVGHPGNPPDVLHGRHGSVPYAFEMARCEVSNQEYARFLGAVATREDPYGLYSPSMSNAVLGGIVCSRASGSCRYAPKPGWERRPVTYISWFDLARYANWLHFGRPDRGVCAVGTTEGTDTIGAYDTRAFQDIAQGRRRPWQSFGRRNRGARYWIPHEDEWYKAAYFDPERTGGRLYWDFPVRTDDLPSNLPPPGDSRSMNYQRGDRLAVGPPFFLAEVDAYANAPSYYGTLQQGGNVWEWLESWQDGRIGIRGLRGGSFGYTEIGPHAVNCDPGALHEETYVFGGRLARAVLAEGWQPPRTGLRQALRMGLERMGTRHWLAAGAVAGSVGFVMGIMMGRCVRRKGGSAGESSQRQASP